MDTLAHGLYGVALSAKNRDERLMFTSAVFGMLPDMITYAVALVSHGNIEDVNLSLYYATHNIFVPAILFILLPKKWRVLAISYGLHVFFDIFTHCSVFSTRIFYPFSDLHFCTLNYADHWWAWEANYGVLVLVFYFIYRKFYKPHLSKFAPK